MRFSKGLVV